MENCVREIEARQEKIITISNLRPEIMKEQYGKDGSYMDDLLKSYIDKVDQDQRDLKEDIRESERRNREYIENSEKRNEERISRIEAMIRDQIKSNEEFKEAVRKDINDNKKSRVSNFIAILFGVIATIIAVVNLYYATISTITSILQLS